MTLVLREAAACCSVGIWIAARARRRPLQLLHLCPFQPLAFANKVFVALLLLVKKPLQLVHGHREQYGGSL